MKKKRFKGAGAEGANINKLTTEAQRRVYLPSAEKPVISKQRERREHKG